jgi:hypothetical protein
MSIDNTHFEEGAESLGRRITEAEMRSTAAATGLAALIRIEADTAQAERRLQEEMDELLLLRRRLWELRSPEDV